MATSNVDDEITVGVSQTASPKDNHSRFKTDFITDKGLRSKDKSCKIR